MLFRERKGRSVCLASPPGSLQASAKFDLGLKRRSTFFESSGPQGANASHKSERAWARAFAVEETSMGVKEVLKAGNLPQSMKRIQALRE